MFDDDKVLPFPRNSAGAPETNMLHILKEVLKEAEPADDQPCSEPVVQEIDGDGNVQISDQPVTRQVVRGNGNVQIAGARGGFVVRTAQVSVRPSGTKNGTA